MSTELYYPVPSYIQDLDRRRNLAQVAGSPKSLLSLLSTPRRGPSIPHPSMWALRMTPGLTMPPTPRLPSASLPELEEDEDYPAPVESLFAPTPITPTTSPLLFLEAPSAEAESEPEHLPQPHIDAFLAVPWGRAVPSFTWDLLCNPLTALLKPENQTIELGILRCVAVRSESMGHDDGLRSLVLVFPFLPLEIEVTHPRTHPSHRTEDPETASPEQEQEAAAVTIWDVLEGLYRGLRAPIAEEELARLSESERGTMQRAAAARCEVLPGDAHALHGLRKVDYLARRRRFLGVRPALRQELPLGRRLGEVFVVEVGTSDLE
ncbi:hypothetical protein C8Q76DRAFT_803524 [Earliella scabrosa]|nr:hypothetical protein C8Q76DRAFT_803524 [Earliella scabrosa]